MPKSNQRSKPIGQIVVVVVSFVVVLLWNWKLHLLDVPSVTIIPFPSDYENHPWLHILLASFTSVIIAAGVHYRIRKLRDLKIIPHLRSLDKGRGRIDEKIERFPHYVGKLFDLISHIIYLPFHGSEANRICRQERMPASLQFGSSCNLSPQPSTISLVQATVLGGSCSERSSY